MSLNTLTEPTKSQGGALLLVLKIVLFYPGMLVGIAWLITNGVRAINADGVTFWPVLSLVVALWVIASWFSPKK